MTLLADTLRSQLIRNFLEVPSERYERAPLYDSLVGGAGNDTFVQDNVDD